MSRHSLDHIQFPQTGTHPSSQAQMSISQLLILVGVFSAYTPHPPTCPVFSCKGNQQAPCSFHQLLKMQDWEARTLRIADVARVQAKKSHFWDAAKKEAKLIQQSGHWYLESFLDYLQYWRHRAGRCDTKLWMTHVPKERQLQPREPTLRPPTRFQKCWN